MKNKVILSMMAVSLGISACSPKSEKPDNRIKVSASAIAASKGTASDKAEEYAKAAELLLTAQGFVQADQLATLSLQQDPTNLRGGLIKVTLAPLLLQKGIMARIKPFYLSRNGSEESYQEMVASFIKDQKSPEFIDYITKGEGDITNEDQAQAMLDKLYQSFDNLRMFMKKNRNAEITVKGTTFLIPDLVHRYANACQIVSQDELEFELVCPDAKTRFDVTLNRGDFEFLTDFASFAQIYVGVLNSYDITGGVSFAKDQDKEEPQLKMDRVLSNAKFGRLRDQQTITRIKALGLDLENGLRWGLANQKELCPKGQQNPQNRVGKFLNVGFCIHPYYTNLINGMRDALTGKPMDIVNSNTKTEYKTQMHLLNFLDNPLRDLHTLGPVKVDKCGQIINLGDTTMGGMYPKGDANLVLAASAEECKK